MPNVLDNLNSDEDFEAAAAELAEMTAGGCNLFPDPELVRLGRSCVWTGQAGDNDLHNPLNWKDGKVPDVIAPIKIVDGFVWIGNAGDDVNNPANWKDGKVPKAKPSESPRYE